MSDEELRAVRPSQLTAAGLRCYEEEIFTRELEPAPEPSLPDGRALETAKALAEKIRREPDTEPVPHRKGFQVALADVAAFYERITNDELLKINPRELTPEALDCYARETERRGLPVQLPAPEPALQQHPDEDREVEALLTEARIWRERQQRRSLGSGRMRPGIAQAVIALISFAISLYQEKSAPSGNRRSVLWLRRFRSRRQDEAFKSLLAEACCGLATVVTVQDSTVFYSMDRGWSRFSWLTNCVIAAILIANFFPFEKTVLIDDIAFAVLALVFLIIFTFRGSGFTAISKEHPAEQVAEVIEGLQRGVNTGSHEPIVLKCDEQSWQTTVAAAEALCDAVVIDIADLSINMEWELGTALQLAPRESIILVCGIENGASEEILPRTVGRIEKIMGAEFMEKRPIVLFPLNPSTDMEESPTAEKLHRLLAEAIVRRKRTAGR